MEDTFVIHNGTIVCHSTSGSTYDLTEDGCPCMGFSFRRTCRHMDGAKAKGLFKRLKKEKRARGFKFLQSPGIHRHRIKAVRSFLQRSGLPNPSGDTIYEVEKMVRRDTTPGTVIALAKESEEKG